jgi:hypothetical protein
MENLFLVPLIRSNPSILGINFEAFIPRELEVERNTEKSREYGAIIKSAFYGMLNPTITNIDGVLLVRFGTYQVFN